MEQSHKTILHMKAKGGTNIAPFASKDLFTLHRPVFTIPHIHTGIGEMRKSVVKKQSHFLSLFPLHPPESA